MSQHWGKQAAKRRGKRRYGKSRVYRWTDGKEGERRKVGAATIRKEAGKEES